MYYVQYLFKPFTPFQNIIKWVIKLNFAFKTEHTFICVGSQKLQLARSPKAQSWPNKKMILLIHILITFLILWCKPYLENWTSDKYFIGFKITMYLNHKTFNQMFIRIYMRHQTCILVLAAEVLISDTCNSTCYYIQIIFPSLL